MMKNMAGRIPVWFGKSTYGGWYINGRDERNNIIAHHVQLLRELREIAKHEGLELAYRVDH